MAKFKNQYAEEQNEMKLNKFRELSDKLPGFMRPYLKHLELSAKPTTMVQYARDLLSFMRFLQAANPVCKDLETNQIPESVIQNLTYHDINEYEAYLLSSSGHNNSRDSINRVINTLRSYFGYEVSHDNLAKDPTNGAEKLHDNKVMDIRFLSHDEVNALLASVDELAEGDTRRSAFSRKTRLRDTAIITLMLNTGIRISECVGLDVSHIDFDEQKLKIIRKGGKISDIYFNGDVADALLDYINLERPAYVKDDATTALFLSNRKQRVTVRTVQYMLNRYGELAEIYDLHPHTLRKTFGTNLYSETGDVELVAEMLGHSNMNTTKKHYSASTKEHMEKNRDYYLYKKTDK